MVTDMKNSRNSFVFDSVSLQNYFAVMKSRYTVSGKSLTYRAIYQCLHGKIRKGGY